MPPSNQVRKRAQCFYGLLKSTMEVITMQINEYKESVEPKIFGLRIYRNTDGCYCFSFRHTGNFSLNDFEELDIKVMSPTLVRIK